MPACARRKNSEQPPCCTACSSTRSPFLSLSWPAGLNATTAAKARRSPPPTLSSQPWPFTTASPSSRTTPKTSPWWTCPSIHYPRIKGDHHGPTEHKKPSTPALSPGEVLPARRRPAGDSERRPRHRGHQEEPAGVDCRREVSRGPVLPPGRCCPQGSLLARAGGRHRPGVEGFPAQLWCRARQARSDFRARCAARPESSPLAG